AAAVSPTGARSGTKPRGVAATVGMATVAHCAVLSSVAGSPLSAALSPRPPPEKLVERPADFDLAAGEVSEDCPVVGGDCVDCDAPAGDEPADFVACDRPLPSSLA